MRSRWLGSMLAWTLNTKPVVSGSVGSIGAGSAGCGRGERRPVGDGVEQLADADVGQRRAEEHRRQVTLAVGLEIEGGQARSAPARAARGPGERRLVAHARRLDAQFGDVGDVRAVGGDARGRCEVEAAREGDAFAQRPQHRGHVEREAVGDLVHDRERAEAVAVDLVDEGDDRDVAQAADLEEFERLRLDALGGVDHHDRGVDRGQRAVGVLGEVLVARRVEQVEGQARGTRRSSPRTRSRCRASAPSPSSPSACGGPRRGRGPGRRAAPRRLRPAAFRSASSCPRRGAR